MTIIIAAHCHDCSVCFQTDSVEAFCRNSDNVSPAGHIALTVLVLSNSNDRSICFQADGVVDSCCNGDNVCPIGHIALTILIVTHRHDRSVGSQADGVRPSCCNGDNRYAVLFLCASRQRAAACGCCTIEQCPQRRLVIASQLVCCGKSIINLRLFRVNFNRSLEGKDCLLIIALGQIAHAEVVYGLPAWSLHGLLRRLFKVILCRACTKQHNRSYEQSKYFSHLSSSILFPFSIWTYG